MGIPNKALRDVDKSTSLTGSSKIDGHYAMHSITDKVRQVDVFGGFTAAAGHNFYTARNYPKEFWNNVAFVSEPTGHVVHIARIEKNGAGFLEEDGWNLFAGADEWVAPVDAKVGPDGAVWVLDWYNFIVQHNPTPTLERGGFAGTNGKGNAYENPLRDKSHGRIWRVVSKGAKDYEPLALDKEKPGDLVDALANDNMFWRMTAQRLLVERGNPDVLPELYELVTNHATEQSGDHFAAIHALWIIDGLGALSKDDKAEEIVKGALNHPSAGVRKAAIQILSKSLWTEESVTKSNVLNDKDPNTRLAAIVSLIEVAPSESLGKTLYALSLEEEVKKDEWLSKAVYAAATQHRKGFLDAFIAANPNYNEQKANEKKREAKDYDDTAWKQMEIPQYMEDRRFKYRRCRLVQDCCRCTRKCIRKSATLSLGAINDSDITYVNGTRGGWYRTKFKGEEIILAGECHLEARKKCIAVRVEDLGGNGGMNGNPEDLFLQVNGKKTLLRGNWKYEVEKLYGLRNQSMFEGTSIGKMFADNFLDHAITPEATTSSEGATLIKIKVIKNEMKYDLKSFTVEAGKPVEITFENPDFMQHNLVIAQVGQMETVGKAADKLASDPKGAEKNYVPDIPEVLFSTKLVNPQQTVTLKFTAPSKAGDYPFVCTFPGHWSIMNGTMKVVLSNPL
jgi:azurin